MVDKSKIVRQFIKAIPYSQALKMECVELGDGYAVFEMPYSEELIGDPRTKVIAGGAVSALMDTCCGAAVISHPSNPGGTATIDLRIEYMRPASPGQRLRTRAECYHITRSVAFVRATTFDEDPQNPVATAAGSFTVESKI
jgi:uncharacterized protein (TIGR00369 family)